MKKVNFNESRFSKFIKGSGFYIALCACVAVVGVAGYVTYKQTSDRLKNQLDSTGSSYGSSDWSYDDINVNIDKNNEEPIVTTTIESKPEVTTSKAKQVAAEPFVMPMNGEVLNEFSNGELIKSKTLNCWKTHDGIDIKGTLGDQVKSMTGGKVISVDEDPLWGVCVVIDHGNGIEGHYYNLNKTIPVKVNEKVSAGTIIGAIGDTAQCEIAEVSHLHFGVKKNGKWINPMDVIK